MPDQWRPAPGHVALLEVDGGADMVGVVIGTDTDAVVISLGSSPFPPAAADVRASFFTPEALYRMRARGERREGSGGVVTLDVRDVERLQRRGARRARIALPARLHDPDSGEPGLSVMAEIVDVGPGGCRVRTTMPFPPGSDPTVSLRLPEGDTVVLPAAVLQMEPVMGHWEYRLVFVSVDEGVRERLLQLVAGAPGAG